MTATQRKPVLIPTLKERAAALVEALLEAPASEQREVLTAWRDALDRALDDLAEQLRPKGELGTLANGEVGNIGSIPVGWIRQQLDIRGGHCHCRALIEASKSND
jgi:hypothetical protein